MKTACVKTLLSLSLLLILFILTGCWQSAEETAEYSNEKTVHERELKGSDQTSGDQTESIDQQPDQNSTEDVEDNSNDKETSLTIAGSPADGEQSNQESPDQQTSPNQDANEEDTPAEPTIDIPATWTRLSEKQEIWFDEKNKQVIVGGKICLTAGPLEMLICPRHTKEHESIVSVNAESWQVHAALLRIGAEPGTPCRWFPEYSPAWGPKIDVQMMWRDDESEQVKTIDGKQWILNSDSGKPMTTEFVFGGSSTETELEGDRVRYQADAGELICLANFATSTIDLHLNKENVDIFFEANTTLIPPVNTQVYTVITPGPVVGKPDE